jgi:pentatricopeptide repeat protein
MISFGSEESQQKSVVPKPSLYTSLIKGCLKAGDPLRAWKAFDHMRVWNCQPDVVIYTEMLHICSEVWMLYILWTSYFLELLIFFFFLFSSRNSEVACSLAQLSRQVKPSVLWICLMSCRCWITTPTLSRTTHC